MLDPMPRQDATLPPREPEATTIATLTAQLAEARSELTQMRDGLTEIANRHVPDQPMADGSDEASYIRKHHTILRVMARDLLERSKPDATAALSRIKREAEDAGIKIALLAGASAGLTAIEGCLEEHLAMFVAERVAPAILALTPDEARKLGEEE